MEQLKNVSDFINGKIGESTSYNVLYWARKLVNIEPEMWALYPDRKILDGAQRMIVENTHLWENLKI